MTEASRKYFGTDGIRGRVGESLINPMFVMKLGWAIGVILGKELGGKVLVGKDTRVSGYMLEAALEAGLSAAGMHTKLLGPMPTPAVAYLTRTLRARAGIVISASHNPYYDNGLKFFSSDGFKLPDAVELAIEEQLEKPMQCVDSAELGKAKRLVDAPGRYIEFCKSTIPSPINFNGMKVVLDCANGATYHVAPAVLTELGAEVIEISTMPDGFNINDMCGSTRPEIIKKIVLAEKADIGIAFDGDGDRVIMVDHHGDIVDGDELLYVIAESLVKREALQGGVVGTLMTNFGLEKAMERLSIPFQRTKVGDRYVMVMLKELGWHLGGESSGHLVDLNLTTTGDGIISALQVLRAMVEQQKDLNTLKKGMHKYPQSLVNVKITQPIDISSQIIQSAVSHVESQLGGSGRVLLRESGTEPVVRVMVEGEHNDQVITLAEELAQAVRNAT
ncbi:MAG: phosphoglucosamine mutase [Coxiellaceae bacterium]|nr:phosphoglucosamine mutase [Coxiellaceae bacterium]